MGTPKSITKEGTKRVEISFSHYFAASEARTCEKETTLINVQAMFVNVQEHAIKNCFPSVFRVVLASHNFVIPYSTFYIEAGTEGRRGKLGRTGEFQTAFVLIVGTKIRKTLIPGLVAPRDLWPIRNSKSVAFSIGFLHIFFHFLWPCSRIC